MKMMVKLLTLVLACICFTFGVITVAYAGQGHVHAFKIEKTDEEWRAQLTDREYHIIRNHGTELPYSSRHLYETEKGIYKCKACGHRLFSSKHKYDSGTGWPSYYKPVKDGAVGESTDYKLGYPRTEVHCARCGGHLGHVFADGPKPTGLRYCINGLALNFTPAH